MSGSQKLLRPARARYLKDQAAFARAARMGDFEALLALAAALNPQRFVGIVDRFSHPELPPGTLRYHVRASGRSYVIPTAVAVAEALEVYKETGRRPAILDDNRREILFSGIG